VDGDGGLCLVRLLPKKLISQSSQKILNIETLKTKKSIASLLSNVLGDFSDRFYSKI
jgi:hypothetical protein